MTATSPSTSKGSDLSRGAKSSTLSRSTTLSPGSRPKCRRFAPKSKGGCLTCRSRHVRCDHARPRCSACRKSARQCRYVSSETSEPELRDAQAEVAVKVVFYEPNARRQAFHDEETSDEGDAQSWDRRLGPARPANSNPVPSGSRPTCEAAPHPPTKTRHGVSLIYNTPSTFPNHTVRERRSLEYFRTVVAERLAGYFSPYFWTDLAFQVAQRVPSLRHGMIAVASHWENVVVPGIFGRSMADWECDAFALRQYTLAIGAMRTSMVVAESRKTAGTKDSGTRELLLSCLLFVCLEMFQNHYESALRQVSCGLSLFCEWERKRPKSTGGGEPRTLDEEGEIDGQLGHIFRRLMTQSLLFPVRRIDERLLVPELTPVMPVVPKRFDSAEQARDSLYDCMAAVLHGVKSRTFPTQDGAAVDTNFLGRWSAAFSTFRARREPTMDLAERRNYVFLEVQRLGVYLWALSSSFTSEMEFDEWMPEFSRLIVLGKWLVDTKHLTVPQGKILHFPKFDSGMILPTYLVASRCRDPKLRRQAIHLLGSGPRQEGVWNGEMLKCLAERILQIEEAGLGTVDEALDVPAWARIRLVDATILTARREVAACFARPGRCGEGDDELLCESIPYTG